MESNNGGCDGVQPDKESEPETSVAPQSEGAAGLDGAAVSALLAGGRVPRSSSYSEHELKQMGVLVEGDMMVLAPGAEALSPTDLSNRLSQRATRLWPRFEVLAEVGSTNAELLARGPEAVGHWVAAEFQSGGRGRRGRRWMSPVGRNIALSLALTKNGPLSSLSGLSLVVGMAVADAMRSLGAEQVALKWPNDLIVMNPDGGYSKLAGILVELQTLPAAEGVLAVIGIGVNVGGAALLSASVDQDLADMSEMAPDVGRNELLATLVNTLADYLDHWRAEGFDGMREVYNTLHAFTGQMVDVRSAERTLCGEVLGVSSDGELRLRDQRGQEHLVDSGEVSLRPAAGLIMDVDLGNSALKYRCGSERGRLAYDENSECVLPVLSAAQISALIRVRVSSVLTESRGLAFAAQVKAAWGCQCEFARSEAATAGVVNGYLDPGALGVDRWLAVVAGYDRVRQAALIVDLGTAATLDYVDDEGKHLGGFIVPGADLMVRALLKETAAIRFDAGRVLDDLQPGRQTRDAVERGAVLTLVQLIRAELERFDALCHHNSRLILCGGGAAAVAPHLKCPHEVVPDLVLDGLALALP